MKQKVVKLIAVLCYWLGFDTLFYFLNKKAKRIITFHNVIPASLLPQGRSIGLTDTEESFHMKIRILKSRFDISIDLLDSKTATITFDDGYVNQSEIAGRILKKEGNLPAIIFAAGRMIGNTTPSDALVVDLLLHWVQLAPNGAYRLTCGCAVVSHFEMITENRQKIWQEVIWPSFCKDSVTKGRTLLNELDDQYSVKNVFASCSLDYLRLRMTGISEADIRELENKGWNIGWHTQEHYPLSKLSSDEKQKEIANSPADMKAVVFSYPYGELDSVDAECLEIVQVANYPFAVSNVGVHNELMSKYFIPRMTLDGNFYRCHMELSGLEYFMKTRKLLPRLK